MEHDDDEVSRVTRTLLGIGTPEEEAQLRGELQRTGASARPQPKRAETRHRVPLKTKMYLLFKRIIDLVAATAFASLLSPLILVLLIRIWMTDGRPFFTRFSRVNRDGKPFDLLEFRVTYRDEEARRKRMYAERPDFNITRDIEHLRNATDTPVGRTIIDYGVQGIPNLWNVIRSNLSIVGPTYSFLGIVKETRIANVNMVVVNELKPGLISLNHALGTWDKFNAEQIALVELYYAHHCSTFLDLKIIAAWFVALIPQISDARRRQLLRLPEFETIREALVKEEPEASEADSRYMREHKRASERVSDRAHASAKV